jgi:hypothetical protein
MEISTLEETIALEHAEIMSRYKDFSAPDLTRDIPTLRKLTTIAWTLMSITSWKHYEVPQNTRNLIRMQREQKNCVIFYDGLHRSLADVVLGPYAINILGRDMFRGNFSGGYIPTTMMGNNLVRKDKGPKERRLAEALERANIVASVERLKNKRQQADRVAFDEYIRLVNMISTLIFSGGTRSRNGKFPDFFPASYQGAIDATKDLRNPYNPRDDVPVYLVHFNIDYSKTLEVKEFVSESHNPAVPHTFSFKNDFKKFMKNPGHVYISLSEPIRINPYDDRKVLAKQSLDACLDLVKILPINIMSKAMVRMNPEPGDYIDINELYAYMDTVVSDLAHHQHKFRRVTADNPKKIVSRSRVPVDSRLMDMYNVYSNYISHYLPE